MIKYIYILLLFISFTSCVERYEFVVINNTEGIVIESFISNKSFNNTLEYPSDGRYFSVKISKTSDVKNVKVEKLSGAKVSLIDELGD